MQVLSNITNNGQGLADVLRLPIRPYAQFWFLYDLFWIFLLYYVLVRLMKLSNKWLVRVAMLLFILSPYLNGWELSRIAYHFIFFILATLNYQQILSHVKLPYISLLAIMLNLLYYFTDFGTFANSILSLVVAYSGILLILNIYQASYKGYNILAKTR